MSAIEILTQHRPYGLNCACDRPINSNDDWARHLSEALKAAGFKVVQFSSFTSEQVASMLSGMSDPAIEAAQRAVNHYIPPGVSPLDAPHSAGAIAGAREALKPIRELHRDADYFDADDGSREFTCDECGGLWPCATAKLIYSPEELS